MPSRSAWLKASLLALAMAVGCSDKGDGPRNGPGVSAGRSAAGAAGSGMAGSPSNSGGSSFTSGDAGESGVPQDPVGGGSGGPSSGGVSGTSTAGSGAVSSSGAAGTASSDLWTCTLSAYGDGACDCGCGLPDPDCANGDLESCEVCDSLGSCNTAKCPGRIDEADTARCEAVPSAWTCLPASYQDGTTCHCGCGITDPDCEGEGRGACDFCATPGSCSVAECPGAIDEADNAQCDFPREWSCHPAYYGDGECHCGCSAQDVDCPSSSVDACESCAKGCYSYGCPGLIVTDNNAFCTNVPSGWRCLERFYNDGTVCNCGCGAFDADCDSTDPDSCDRCNVEGACSGQDCPGTIDPDDVRKCMKPDPPPEWSCEDASFGDGLVCHCGCGAFDVDCRDTTLDACDDCVACGACGGVDPSDLSSCLPTPDGWTCPDESYADSVCDCGCGVLDPDCSGNDIDNCGYCPPGSCSFSDCRDVDPTDITSCDRDVPEGWVCPENQFGDLACDCGCGALDEDCPSSSASVCDFCDSPGSCSEACPGDINPEDNAVCD
jgi:hypothetical protein